MYTTLNIAYDRVMKLKQAYDYMAADAEENNDALRFEITKAKKEAYETCLRIMEELRNNSVGD